MSKKYKIGALCLLIIVVLVMAVAYLHGNNIQVLNPKGPIARQERNLIYTALALSLIVVIPVYSLAIIFAVRYREGNTKAKYSPNLSGNRIAETIWWIVPSIIILILAVITWRSSHTLDPYRPIVSKNKPLTIQVVALDWKWLFIYPQQNVASVNLFEFPENTPLDFEITSDAPMNSFWIPQLGGQIYAMPGMSTQLHLLASSQGSFDGSSANISGKGFAGMTFTAKSTSAQTFQNWLMATKHSSTKLGLQQYDKLMQPSENNPPSYYSLADSNLYYSIIDKYVAQSGQSMSMSGAYQTDSSNQMQGMSM